MTFGTDQFFYGHGKLLLSGEYFVLKGALALALPTKHGQSLSVRYERSEKPKLNWRSFDAKGKCWFEADFDLWHFNLLAGENNFETQTLQNILRQVRVQNPHFLREGYTTYVETRLEFPLSWGLGSSSTLLYNIAQWAYVSPFELSKETLGGSGYDIACAQAFKPIFYHNSQGGPEWKEANFNPLFQKNLYFVYLNQKQNTREQIALFEKKEIADTTNILKEISEISMALTQVEHLSSFETLLNHHEDLIAKTLNLPKVKELHFQDFKGSVKSLGAWGGDFCLVTSTESEKEVKTYFKNKGFDSCLRYDELINTPISSQKLIQEQAFVAPIS